MYVYIYIVLKSIEVAKHGKDSMRLFAACVKISAILAVQVPIKHMKNLHIKLFLITRKEKKSSKSTKDKTRNAPGQEISGPKVQC